MSDASQTIRSRALAITAVLAWVLAARVAWHAWIYYFENGARYRLESAAMAFLLVAGIVALLGRRSPLAIHHPQSLPWWWGVVFMSGAFVLYYQALFLGLLSDNLVPAGDDAIPCAGRQWRLVRQARSHSPLAIDRYARRVSCPLAWPEHRPAWTECLPREPPRVPSWPAGRRRRFRGHSVSDVPRGA